MSESHAVDTPDEEAARAQRQAQARKAVKATSWPDGWSLRNHPMYDCNWEIFIKVPDSIWPFRLGVLIYGEIGDSYECCLHNGKNARGSTPRAAVRLVLSEALSVDAVLIAAKSLGVQ